MLAKHVPSCIHLLFAALLVATLKLHIPLFRFPYLTHLCFVVDIGAVCRQISHEEAQFCVVNITLSFSHLHILPLFMLGVKLTFKLFGGLGMFIVTI